MYNKNILLTIKNVQFKHVKYIYNVQLLPLFISETQTDAYLLPISKQKGLGYRSILEHSWVYSSVPEQINKTNKHIKPLTLFWLIVQKIQSMNTWLCCFGPVMRHGGNVRKEAGSPHGIQRAKIKAGRMRLPVSP